MWSSQSNYSVTTTAVTYSLGQVGKVTEKEDSLVAVTTTAHLISVEANLRFDRRKFYCVRSSKGLVLNTTRRHGDVSPCRYIAEKHVE